MAKFANVCCVLAAALALLQSGFSIWNGIHGYPVVATWFWHADEQIILAAVMLLILRGNP